MRTLALALIPVLYTPLAHAETFVLQEADFGYEMRVDALDEFDLVSDVVTWWTEHDAPNIALEFDDGLSDPVGTIKPRVPIAGTVSYEIGALPEYREVGKISGIESVLSIDSISVAYAGDPIVYLAVDPERIQTGIQDITFAVTGMWDFGAQAIPFAVDGGASVLSYSLRADKRITLALAFPLTQVASMSIGNVNYDLKLRIKHNIYVIPEPGTLLLMGLGLAGLSAAGRAKEKLLLP